MRIIPVVVAVVLLLSSQVSTDQRSDQRSGSAELTYEQFISLDSDQRRERLARMRPEAIAVLKRTHAERWFATHGPRLSPAQVAVFQEALAFITIEAYSEPRTPAKTKQEDQITNKLTCVLGAENTRQAFVLHLPPQSPVPLGWRSIVDPWLSWFFDCVAP